MSAMTFHECYGELPVATLRLIKKCNLSPSDFQDVIAKVKTWREVDQYILSNSTRGYYQAPWG